MAERIVVALGGNALGNTPEEQLELVRHTAKTIVDLSEAGYEVIVGHGNGPQVGMINLAMEFSSTKGGNFSLKKPTEVGRPVSLESDSKTPPLEKKIGFSSNSNVTQSIINEE